MITHFAAFLGVAVVLIVTPGPDTALTIRNALRGGRRGALLTALGVSSGQAIWTLAASAGLAAVIAASEPAFVAVRLAGAAYLVFLGAQSLLAALRGRLRQTLHGGPAGGARTAYRQGVLSNLGNPKMAVFFTSLLPQFVPGSHASFAGLLLLGGIFAAMTLAWLAAYGAAAARAGDLLRRPRMRRTLDAVTGATLVAFGLRLASERRA